jgi:hypothetical protein
MQIDRLRQLELGRSRVGGRAARGRKARRSSEGRAASVANNSSNLFHETNSHNGARGRLHLSAFAVSRQVGRLRRVCSSRMMLMKKYGEAISQERIVGNRGLKESFLHITR